MTPRTGNRAIGSSAVAGMGIASVIHQTIIRAATATTRQASTDRPSGAGSSRSATNSASPVPMGTGLSESTSWAGSLSLMASSFFVRRPGNGHKAVRLLPRNENCAATGTGQTLDGLRRPRLVERGPRVDHPQIEICEVCDVAGRHGKAVDDGGGGDQAVGVPTRAQGGKATPFFCNGFGDG